MDEATQAAIDAARIAAEAVDRFNTITVIFMIIVVFALLFGGAGVIIFMILRSSNSNQQFSQESARSTMGTAQELRNEVGVMRNLQGEMVALETVRSKSMTTLAEAQTVVATNIAALTNTLAESLPAMVKALTENTAVLKEVVTGQAKITQSTDSIDETLKAIAAIIQLLKVQFPVMAEYLLRPTDAGKVEIEAMAKSEPAAVSVTA